MTKDRSARLRLAEAESRHSRYVFLPLDEAGAFHLTTTGMVMLGRSNRERHTWSAIRAGDLVIAIVSRANDIVMYACRVSGRGIQRTWDAEHDSPPLLIHVEILGSRKNPPLRPAAVFPQAIFATRALFEEAWEGCVAGEWHPIDAPLWRLIIDDHDITVAQTAADDDFVHHVSERHPFGFSESFLTLIARRGDTRVGAALMSPAWPTPNSHRATWRIFREQYVHIREHAVSIQRLYSVRNVSRWRVHRALLNAAAEVAPYIARRPLSIIEGVSYDYHPTALGLGYNIDIPRKPTGSFYYWKPFTVPSTVELPQQPTTTDPRFYDALRKLLKQRSDVHYWLAWTHSDMLPRAVDRGAWALHRNSRNNGRWKLLRPGHVVFLTTHEGRVRAAGVVRATEIRSVEGLEPFPLWIDFEASMLIQLEIDVRAVTNTRWFKDQNRGGLLPLPGEVGGRIMAVAEQQRTGRKMVIEPNPYLLHQTQFEVVPKQIFVVQSAALSHTVLPVIKRILEPLGYTVKYWGDRGGQLVFDDVWLLLNESEAIIVDFTEKRPNVYLEYGMALVLGKPVVAITQRKEDIPSDTPGLKFILYNDRLGDTELTKNLARAIEHTVSGLEQLRSERVVSI